MVAKDGTSPDPRVAVVGTGIMGSAMARNLVAAGLHTTVWDHSAPATDVLAATRLRAIAEPMMPVPSTAT